MGCFLVQIAIPMGPLLGRTRLNWKVFQSFYMTGNYILTIKIDESHSPNSPSTSANTAAHPDEEKTGGEIPIPFKAS